MAKMEIIGKKAIITGMNVAGGDLPKGFEVKLNVTIDFENCPMEDILKYAAGGQSARVALQTKLRELPTSKLNELAKKPNVDVSAIAIEKKAVEIFMTPQEVALAMVEKMTPEQKVILRKALQG